MRGISPLASFITEDFKYTNSGLDSLPNDSDYDIISNHAGKAQIKGLIPSP
jgi:hypothetical protein